MVFFFSFSPPLTSALADVAPLGLAVVVVPVAVVDVHGQAVFSVVVIRAACHRRGGAGRETCVSGLWGHYGCLRIR